MTKYYKIHDSKEELYVTVDDSGAMIIKDNSGKKVFLTRYQASLMKQGLEKLLAGKNKDSTDVYIEELKSEK